MRAGGLVVKLEGPCLDHVDSPEFSVDLYGLGQQAGVRDEGFGPLAGHHDRHDRLAGRVPAAEPDSDADPGHVRVVAVGVEYLLLGSPQCGFGAGIESGHRVFHPAGQKEALWGSHLEIISL